MPDVSENACRGFDFRIKARLFMPMPYRDHFKPRVFGHGAFFRLAVMHAVRRVRSIRSTGMLKGFKSVTVQHHEERGAS